MDVFSLIFIIYAALAKRTKITMTAGISLEASNPRNLVATFDIVSALLTLQVNMLTLQVYMLTLQVYMLTLQVYMLTLKGLNKFTC